MEKESLLGKLADNTQLAIIVIGVALLIMGAAGGVSKAEVQITEPGWRIAVAVMGVLTTLGGVLLFWRKGSEFDPKTVLKYDIQITSPSKGHDPYIVKNGVDVGGTYKRRPPAGTEVMIFETNAREEYWLKGYVEFDPNRRKGDWIARNIRVGSSVGTKILAVCIVGKAGQALCAYQEEVGKETAEAAKRVPAAVRKEVQRVPGISKPAPYIVNCDKVVVRRSEPLDS